MKNLSKLFIFTALAGAFLLASCSDDPEDVPPMDSVLTIDYTSSTPLYTARGAAETVNFKAENVSDLAVDIPAGWKAEISGSSITVTAPAVNDNSSKAEVTLTLTGITKNYSQKMSARMNFYTTDYSDESGIFLLVEGNSSTENGTVSYIDKYGKLHRNVYESVNDGREIGNVLQDMFISDGKIYFLSQDGSSLNGDGHIVVADAVTMVAQDAFDLNINATNGVSIWPQHLVVAENRAYVQYSTSDWETHSGIRMIDLKDHSDLGDVNGTYGEFNSEGATKGRLLLSGGNIYAPCGTSLKVIDAEAGTVSASEDYERIIKGVVKGSDGNVYIAVAGEYTPGADASSPVTFTSNASIIQVDNKGEAVNEYELPEEVELPVFTWDPSIGICAAFDSPAIYFTAGQDFTKSVVYKFDITSHKTDKYFTLKFKDEDGEETTGGESIYGYLGMGLKNKGLYVPYSVNYATSGFITTSNDNVIEFSEGTPAGVDFAYRFSEAYLK